ncbi:MAG: DedA family protein [Bacilli bacterium]|nr:DedA family protein [Bacilli bacterium]
MDSFLLFLIHHYGYFGMFLGMVLEAVIIVIPSELILATGGILAYHGIFSFWGAFMIGLLGSIFCAILLYFMGYYGGEKFIEKYGKYFFMKKDDLLKTDSWFYKYGMLSALIGRNFPIIRTLISIPIGVTRQSFLKFVLYTTLGSIPWTFAFVSFGYLLGENWIVVNSYIEYLKIPIWILLSYLFLKFIIKKIHQ